MLTMKIPFTNVWSKFTLNRVVIREIMVRGKALAYCWRLRENTTQVWAVAKSNNLVVCSTLSIVCVAVTLNHLSGIPRGSKGPYPLVAMHLHTVSLENKGCRPLCIDASRPVVLLVEIIWLLLRLQYKQVQNWQTAITSNTWPVFQQERIHDGNYRMHLYQFSLYLARRTAKKSS